MSISAKQVNELRKQTGAGLMDCKKALTESNGDIEAAIDILRKKGQKVSELRSGRDAKEGAVIAKTNADGTKGSVIHLTSETDFVARNQEFVDFAHSIVDIALEKNITDLDTLMATELNGASISDLVNEKVAAIGESISLRTIETLTADMVVPYIHAGNKIGVLVGLNKTSDEARQMGKDLAMQIAAMNPIALDESGVPEEVKEREFAIGKEQVIAEGKPEHMIEQIATGKLKKFFKENTLINQAFVKDGSKTVSQALQEVDADLKVTSFHRVSLG